MTSPALDLDAPLSTTGSAPAAPELYTCEVCGKQLKAKIALYNHLKTHDPKPGQGPGIEPEIKVKRAPKLSEKELADLQAKMAENLRAVGGLLHAGLMSLKVLRLQHPEGRVQVPGTHATVRIPAVDTHLAYAVISRSELTAKVLIDHAAQNETLLKWVVRVNGWFEGGEVGQVIGAHAAAAVMTAGVQTPILSTVAGALISDVIDQVEAEDRELRHQVAKLQAQMAGAAAGDERGAGNHAG